MQTLRITALLPLFLFMSSRAAQADPDWLSQLNFFRRMLNLPQVVEDRTLSNGANKHAIYCVRNDYIGHTEDRNNRYYTQEGARAAANSVVSVASYNQSGAEAINGWMEAPFHALSLLNPGLRKVGFGSATDTAGRWRYAAVLDTQTAPQSDPSNLSYPLIFPPDGSYTPILQTGIEHPDPLSGCSGYTVPAGAPIMIQVGGNSAPRVTASAFRSNGRNEPHCMIHESNYANPNASDQSLARRILARRHTVIIIPKNRLVSGRDYEVSLTVNGQAYSWSFTTNPVRRRQHNLLWRHRDGLHGVWYMNVDQYAGAAWTGYIPDKDWRIVGTGDFNNDGDTDILYRHFRVGHNGVWFMKDAVYQYAAFIPAETDLGWEIVGTGDFNRDGRVDILWRHATRAENRIWLMDGVKRLSTAHLVKDGDPNWKVVGTGDVNGDNQYDIIWRHKPQGLNAVWILNGTRYSDFAWLPPALADWDIAAVGDLNEDNKPDLIFRHGPTGLNAAWCMNGTAILSGHWLPWLDPVWELVGTGDFEDP